MAELTAFSFQPGTSLLHKLDVRFKLLFLILISLVSLGGGFTGLGILTDSVPGHGLAWILSAMN